MKFVLDSTQYEIFSYNLALFTKLNSAKNILIRLVCCDSKLLLISYGPLGKLEINTMSQLSEMEDGDVVIQEDFIKLIKNLNIPDNTKVTFALKSSVLHVKLSGSKSKYSVKVLPSNLIEAVNFENYTTQVEIDSNKLVSGLNSKLFCKTDAETSDIFNSLNLSVTNNSLTFIASNTSMLLQVKYDQQFASSFDILIPYQVATFIQSLLANIETPVYFGVTATGHGLLISNNIKYLFSPFSGKYPDTSGILIMTSPEKIPVNAQDLLNVLNLINNLSTVKIIHFNIVDSNIVIKNTDSDIVDIEEVLSTSSSKTFEFYMLLKPLITFLAQFKAKNALVDWHLDKKILLNVKLNDVNYTMVTTPVNKQ